MSRTGRCHNFEHCVRAYRNDAIALGDDDEMICPECGQPLKPGAGRSRGCLVPIILIVAVLLVLVGAVARLFYVQSQRLDAPEAESSDEVLEEANVEQTQAPSPSPEALAEPMDEPEAAATDTEEEISVPETIELDASAAQNRAVKGEVLKRIDLMPNVSEEDKDHLYVSVERARQMGKIIKIPFGFGKKTLSPQDVENLREALSSPQVRSVMADPTAVFVILGYADTKGAADKNLKISTDRAEVVLAVLRDQLGVLNVLHALGMGSSTMFDENGLDRNRVVEVWAVLP